VGRGLGECSAGLFDLIDLDMNLIIKNKEKILQTSEKTAINEYLYAIIYSSSRMLLITKGIEPKNDQELFDAFINKFIDEGLIDQKFKFLIEKAKQNPNDDFIPDKDTIYLLSDAVIELYENMDDSLQFKTEAAKPVTVDKKTEVVKIKDFRGIKCPLNYVKTKMELSALKSGDLLEILLDDGEPIENVPGSVKSEGHNIIKQDRIDNYWSVLIQKR
jgi:sulfite reductase (ferredoxin)